MSPRVYRLCNATSPEGFQCTRRHGHALDMTPHQAHGEIDDETGLPGGEVLAEWPVEATVEGLILPWS